MPTARKAATARPSPPHPLGGVSSDAVAKATGKTWPEWIALLDSAGAGNLPHKEIASLLRKKHNVSGWWSQMVTVGYEQARGRRIVGQTCAGDYAASASKTLPVSAAAAHRWFSDATKRGRWLGKTAALRTATAPKSARLQFPDGSIAGAWITPKGEHRCSVGISHDKLPDAKTAAKHKAFWHSALERLASCVASSNARTVK